MKAASAKSSRWYLVLVPMVVLTLGSWIVVSWEETQARREQRMTIAQEVATLEGTFFQRYQSQAAWLASHPFVGQFLSSSSTSEQAQRLQGLLETTSQLSGLEMAFLVNSQGTIVSSSRKEYVGTDVSYRPFVREALAGTTRIYLAKGIAPKSRGVYFAAPVWGSGRVIGAAVFRLEIVLIDWLFHGHSDLYLLTSEGIVFNASRPSEIYGLTRPLTEFEEFQMETERRFSGVELFSLGWHWEGANWVTIQGKLCRVESQPLESLPGHRIVSVQEFQLPWQNLLLVDSSLVVFLLFMALFFRHRRWMTTRNLIEREQNRLRALFENSLVGMALADSSGIIEWSNPTLQRLLEVEADAVLGRSLESLWTPGTAGLGHEVLIGHRQWLIFNAVLRTQSGAWIPVAAGLNALPVDHKNVEQRGFMLSVLDMSERVRTEQALHQSQKLAVLGQLAGGIAHDFNNILGGLMGMTELIQTSLPEDDPLQEPLDVMFTAFTRASGLAEKMLNFARQTPHDYAPVDIGALINELKFLTASSMSPGIEKIYFNRKPGLWIMGDSNLLQSALLNLVINACESMGGRGTLSVICDQDEKGLATIRIQDTGEGIPPENLSKIFEPFFTTKHDKKGTGLGLSLVKRTVQDHRGKIEVTSTVGEGTRFTLRFPVVPAPDLVTQSI